MKRITITAFTIIAALLMASCATAQAEQEPAPREPVEFKYVCDWNQHTEPSIIEKIAENVQKAQQEAQEAEQEPVYEEYDYEADYYYEEPYSASYSGDGFMQAGVREGVDSATETWYSSNQAYHYRTSEWSTDDEGYYRTDDGYYVVASNDYPEGTVINTSKGEAKVLDDGTESGNVDFYVAW